VSAYIPLKQPIFTPTRSAARRRPAVRFARNAFAAGVATTIGCVLLAGFGLLLRSALSDSPAPALVPTISSRSKPMLAVSGVSADRRHGFVTVTGIAENLTVKPLDKLEVMAELFDRSGRLIAVETAPAEITTLAPGDQTPFTVTARETSETASFRVQVRKALGPVLPSEVR
jgi:hypothetical protein